MASDGQMRIRVREPKGPYRLWINGQAVEAKADSGWVSFELPLRNDQAVSWRIASK